MSVDYKHWYKLDKWTFEEAACLFGGSDPSITIPDGLFERYQKLLSSASPTIWISMESYNIFLHYDWSEIDSNALLEKKSLKENFISIAYKNDMDIAPELLDALGHNFLFAVRDKIITTPE